MKKFIIRALVPALIVCTLSSCNKGDMPGPSPSPSATPAIAAASPDNTPSEDMDELPLWPDLVYSATLEISPGLTLIAEAQYPQTGIPEIDDYYEERMTDFKAAADGIVQDYGEFPPDAIVSQYVLDDSYELIHNSNGILSIHRTVYQFSGGAHGNHYDVCDNFRLTGGRLTLRDIFDVPTDEYTEAVCAVFDAFIDNQRDISGGYSFFDNAKSALRDEFPYSTFCITDSGLLFYISPYFISPYSEGTVVIPVSFDTLSIPLQDWLLF